jgi:hypothetical protein
VDAAPTPIAAAERVLGTLVDIVAAVLAVAEVAILFAGIVARYVLHAPLTWSDELASTLFLWLAMLGAVVALRRGEHMRMTSLVSRLSAPARAWFDSLPQPLANRRRVDRVEFHAARGQPLGERILLGIDHFGLQGGVNFVEVDGGWRGPERPEHRGPQGSGRHADLQIDAAGCGSVPQRRRAPRATPAQSTPFACRQRAKCGPDVAAAWEARRQTRPAADIVLAAGFALSL